MGLDLWFRDDVARILASAHLTMQASVQALPGAGAGSPGADEAHRLYQRGFTDALGALAVAFGVAPPASSLPAYRDREACPHHALALDQPVLGERHPRLPRNGTRSVR